MNMANLRGSLSTLRLRINLFVRVRWTIICARLTFVYSLSHSGRLLQFSYVPMYAQYRA